jgi:hypothetical protein
MPRTARAGVLSPAQSCSSYTLALPRWRVESMDAVAVDCACQTVSPVARLERPCLAGLIQSVSYQARRSSPNGVARHRTKSGPGESRVTSQKLRWSSAHGWRDAVRGPRVESCPAARPQSWLDWVNGSMEERDVQRIRQSATLRLDRKSGLQ